MVSTFFNHRLQLMLLHGLPARADFNLAILMVQSWHVVQSLIWSLLETIVHEKVLQSHERFFAQCFGFEDESAELMDK